MMDALQKRIPRSGCATAPRPGSPEQDVEGCRVPRNNDVTDPLLQPAPPASGLRRSSADPSRETIAADVFVVGGGGNNTDASQGTTGDNSYIGNSEVPLVAIGGGGGVNTDGHLTGNPGGSGGGALGGGESASGDSKKIPGADGTGWKPTGDAWITAVTGVDENVEFARGGNGGGKDVVATQGANYGDGGSGSGGVSASGGAGHNGIVIIRFINSNVTAD
jgi:hypothetical protein